VVTVASTPRISAILETVFAQMASTLGSLSIPTRRTGPALRPSSAIARSAPTVVAPTPQPMSMMRVV
jgi:hypothetical protein